MLVLLLALLLSGTQTSRLRSDSSSSRCQQHE
jgi:hypothetical protein